MLIRQCIKITSSTRSLHYKKVLNSTKLPRPCACRSNDDFLRTSRLLSTPPARGAVKIHNNKEKTDSAELIDKTRLFKSRPISTEDLVERMVAGLSSDIHLKNRVYRNDLLKVVNKIREVEFSTKKQGLLLIRCCTELLPDETPASRMTILEQVWSAIKPHTKFEVEHYNQLLNVYIANNRTITASAFIHQMAPVKPNLVTYELILRALAEAGDLNQATEVISNMKSLGFPATENIFNSLIVCQGKAGKVDNVQEVLEMMKSLKIDFTADTYTAIARVLALNKKGDALLDVMNKAHKDGLEFAELHIMEIVKTLAVVGTYGTLSKVMQYLPQEILKSPSITPYMQSVSTLLVFQNHPIAALEIYKCLPLPSFGPKDDKGLHGRSLVRDCVKASMPSSVIALVTEELMSSGRNPIAIQNAAEAALQLGKVPLALDLFNRMKQLGMPIRQHFFWPILIYASKTNGEKGIMSTLATMVSMDVKPDYETIMQYTLPHVSFTSPQNLMKKFVDTGLTVSTVLTPMMETLLKTGQVRAASEICEIFQGKVDVEKLLKPLLKGYLTSMDVKSTVHILEDINKKALVKNTDWAGRFLCTFAQNDKVKIDISDFLTLIKALKDSPVRISTTASDYCMSAVNKDYSPKIIDDMRAALINIIDEGLYDETEIFYQETAHPRNMNEEGLRAHLVELETKGMNTRGVLRRLLQIYCREGNLDAAREISVRCHNEGIFLSAGMKASIFDLHVKLGELDHAEMILDDLNKTSPNFTLDEFKVIDFATLMVYRKKFDQAIEMITEQSKKRRVIGGNKISMNCWRLLDATASYGSYADVLKMFQLLTSLRYCKPTNTLMGPLIRVHLKNDNVEEAVEELVRLSTKYNKTPLKHELLCKVLLIMSDGQSEENFIANEKNNGKHNKLVQKILNADKKVHGAGDVQLTLIVALADVGYKKTLRKMLLDPSVKFHPDALMRRCERFVDEGRLAALEALAEGGRGLRAVDAQGIYEMILDVYQREDNYTEALKFWNRLQENDFAPSQKFVRNLCALIRANNKPVPAELLTLLDSEKAQPNRAV